MAHISITCARFDAVAFACAGEKSLPRQWRHALPRARNVCAALFVRVEGAKRACLRYSVTHVT
jgi:hypothetical protein